MLCAAHQWRASPLYVSNAPWASPIPRAWSSRWGLHSVRLCILRSFSKLSVAEVSELASDGTFCHVALRSFQRYFLMPI